MIWVYIHGHDGRLLLVCPATDAHLWSLRGRWFRYALVEEASQCP